MFWYADTRQSLALLLNAYDSNPIERIWILNILTTSTFTRKCLTPHKRMPPPLI